MGTVLPLRRAFTTYDIRDESFSGPLFGDLTPEGRRPINGVGRRITDRVMARWDKAPAKFQMLQRLIGSQLWEHCFLLIPDEEFSASAVVGYGSSAMLALGLTEKNFNSVQHVPRYLHIPLRAISTECLIDNAAHDYSGTAEVPEEDATYRFRMAAMPITSPIPIFPGAPIRTKYILGVLTYRTIH